MNTASRDQHLKEPQGIVGLLTAALAAVGGPQRGCTSTTQVTVGLQVWVAAVGYKLHLYLHRLVSSRPAGVAGRFAAPAKTARRKPTYSRSWVF